MYVCLTFWSRTDFWCEFFVFSPKTARNIQSAENDLPLLSISKREQGERMCRTGKQADCSREIWGDGSGGQLWAVRHGESWHNVTPQRYAVVCSLDVSELAICRFGCTCCWSLPTHVLTRSLILPVRCCLFLARALSLTVRLGSERPWRTGSCVASSARPPSDG